MARPMTDAELRRRLIREHDPTAVEHPPRPSWAWKSPKKEDVVGALDDGADGEERCFTVAERERSAYHPMVEHHGPWVTSEFHRLRARLDEDNDTVWFLLITRVEGFGPHRMHTKRRWVCFDEFAFEFPNTAQILRPVDDACYRRVRRSGWAESEWEQEDFEGDHVDPDDKLVQHNELDHRERVLDQRAIRARWRALFQ